jgi:hypothetical protein
MILVFKRKAIPPSVTYAAHSRISKKDLISLLEERLQHHYRSKWSGSRDTIYQSIAYAIKTGQISLIDGYFFYGEVIEWIANSTNITKVEWRNAVSEEPQYVTVRSSQSQEPNVTIDVQADVIKHGVVVPDDHIKLKKLVTRLLDENDELRNRLTNYDKNVIT